MKNQSGIKYALLPIFVACIALSFRDDKQSVLKKQYEYSFGYESAVPGKLVSYYHKIVIKDDRNMEYQRCKIVYRSGNFEKTQAVDTLKIPGKYSFSEKNGLLTLNMGDLDSGIEFPISGDYKLENGAIICLIKGNKWFYSHRIFEVNHFEKCSASATHRQKRQVKKVYNKRSIEMWTCETENWAVDFEIK